MRLYRHYSYHVVIKEVDASTQRNRDYDWETKVFSSCQCGGVRMNDGPCSNCREGKKWES